MIGVRNHLNFGYGNHLFEGLGIGGVGEKCGTNNLVGAALIQAASRGYLGGIHSRLQTALMRVRGLLQGDVVLRLGHRIDHTGQ